MRRGGIAAGTLEFAGHASLDPTVEVGVAEPRIGTGLLRTSVITFDQRSQLVRLNAPEPHQGTRP